ncbi:MAG TPA: SDR family NAD(P)-dependent oxidoreductase [Ilumatobacteraceae bacterium]|nr:SDR family NAD(P)-dependent oxidoreductase [Ilumatobacteraceae bacterium]
MGSLDGRVAIVTGASRGIGAEIARRFAADGARVAVSARTTEAGQSAFEGTIHETVQSIVDAGGAAVAVAANLARPEDRARLVAETEQQLGPVDVLVNNGAVTWFGPVETFQEKHFRMMFEVQVRAPFELAQLVLPGMRERRWGAILNISSKGAIHPEGPPFSGRAGTGGTVYGMVKAALERFTTGLAAEVHGDNVRVNVLSPTSIVPTPGVVHHRLLTPEREHLAEPVDVMASAALALVTDPPGLTGRVAYSQQLLWELGRGPQPLTELLVAEHPRIGGALVEE